LYPDSSCFTLGLCSWQMCNRTQNSHLRRCISQGLEIWQHHPIHCMTISLVGIWTCTVYIHCLYSIYISVQCTGSSCFTPELLSWKTSCRLNTLFLFKTVYFLQVRGFTTSSYIVYESQSVSKCSFSSHFNIIRNISLCEPAKPTCTSTTLLTWLRPCLTVSLIWKQHWRDDTFVMLLTSLRMWWKGWKVFHKWPPGMFPIPLQLLAEVYSCTRGLFQRKCSLNGCNVLYFWEIKWFWEHFEGTM